MAMYKHNYLKELWWNRPWVYIPDVVQYMKDYPFKRNRDNFRIWLRNCLYINWQVCLVRVEDGN